MRKFITTNAIAPSSIALGYQGYNSLYYYDEKFRRKLRDAGIFAIISIIIFYILAQFGIISNLPPLSQYYQWGSGFYMVILASILFIFLYFLTGEIDPFEKEEPKVKREMKSVPELKVPEKPPTKKPEKKIVEAVPITEAKQGKKYYR